MSKHIDIEMEEIERLCEAKRKGIPMPNQEIVKADETPHDSAEASTTGQNRKPMNLFLKILIGIVVTVFVVIGLAVLYQVLEFLFVAAILLIAWVGPRGRWWWH